MTPYGFIGQYRVNVGVLDAPSCMALIHSCIQDSPVEQVLPVQTVGQE